LERRRNRVMGGGGPWLGGGGVRAHGGGVTTKPLTKTPGKCGFKRRNHHESTTLDYAADWKRKSRLLFSDFGGREIGSFRKGGQNERTTETGVKERGGTRQ